MKIAITGHTKGIGLAIKKYFENLGHEVIGFSRTSGYDLQLPENRNKLISLITDCDIFVNNAYGDIENFQFILLETMFKEWHDTDKIIINISTRYTNGNDRYSICKKKLDEFCEQHVYKKPSIINLKPGLTDTDRVRTVTGLKMSTKDITDILNWILTQPNIKIHSVCFGR